MSVRRIIRSDHVVGWAFAFPAIALIVAFGIVPIVWSALMSFQKTNLLSTPEWIGLDNYRALPKDPLFKTSIVHAMIYAALFVPLSVGGGLFAAVALNRHIRGIRFYRLAVFVPVVVSTIATSIMFLWLFDPNFGLANWLLGKVRAGAVRVLHQLGRRALLDHRDDGVGVDRVRRHHLSRRAAGRAPGAARGRRSSTARGRGASSATSRCRCSDRPRCSSWCSPRSTRSRCSTRCTS